MNDEVIKAMSKKKSKKEINIERFRKWWNQNGYKVMRVALFPVWIGVVTGDKITSYLDSREKWSEKRVDEILSYYIPRKAEWNAEDKCFYFFDNSYGWSMCFAKKYLKRKDRRFWELHKGWAGGKIRHYLIDEFELEGFEKEVDNCDDDLTEITFKMIEK